MRPNFYAGEVEAAQSTLQHCIDRDATFSDAHILMAQVEINARIDFISWDNNYSIN